MKEPPRRGQEVDAKGARVYKSETSTTRDHGLRGHVLYAHKLPIAGHGREDRDSISCISTVARRGVRTTTRTMPFDRPASRRKQGEGARNAHGAAGGDAAGQTAAAAGAEAAADAAQRTRTRRPA